MRIKPWTKFFGLLSSLNLLNLETTVTSLTQAEIMR